MLTTSFLETKLAKAFFASAQANHADIYVDSFGRPYFFHRARFEADLLSEKPRERVTGLFLLDGTDEVISTGRPMDAGTARELFRTLHSHDGIGDSLGKELLGAKLEEQYRILGDMLPDGKARHWDWTRCVFYVLDAKKGNPLMKIQRYPVVGEDA